jgi:hypothetical protein
LRVIGLARVSLPWPSLRLARFELGSCSGFSRSAIGAAWFVLLGERDGGDSPLARTLAAGRAGHRAWLAYFLSRSLPSVSRITPEFDRDT